MKVDLDAKITDLEGRPTKDGEKDMTLSSVICSAMLVTVPGDQELSSDEKVRMFKLAQSAIKAGQQELSVEDVAFLKKRIGKLFGPLVVGRAFDLLEQKETSNA